jgi:hypothetical protein
VAVHAAEDHLHLGIAQVVLQQRHGTQELLPAGQQNPKLGNMRGYAQLVMVHSVMRAEQSQYG